LLFVWPSLKQVLSLARIPLLPLLLSLPLLLFSGVLGRAASLIGGILGGSPASSKPTSSSSHSHEKPPSKKELTSGNGNKGFGRVIPKISEAKEPEGDFGRASLQVELVGAPCDQRRWACDEVRRTSIYLY
jgi:hypothetical protein